MKKEPRKESGKDADLRAKKDYWKKPKPKEPKEDYPEK